MARYPEGWNQIFETWGGHDSEMKTAVANFGVKFRLTHDLSSAAFDGDSATSDSYYILLKASLLYSAIEAWGKIVGKDHFSVADPELAKKFLSAPKSADFLNTLTKVTRSKALKNRLGGLGANESGDLFALLSAVRHGFFHPHLTANNCALSSDAELRSALLLIINSVRGALETDFAVWIQNNSRSLREKGPEGDQANL